MDDPVETDRLPLAVSGRSIIATTVVSLSLALVSVTLRIWARRLRNISIFYSEDIVCYVALVSFPAFAIARYIGGPNPPS